MFSSLLASLNKLTTPASRATQNELTYWRERILLWGLLIATVLGFFAYIAGLAHFIREGMWGIITIDTVAYGIIILLFIFRRLPYFLRAGSAVLILYFLGIYLLYKFGFYGGGILWLFAFPVMTGVLLGMQAALAALVITATSMGGIDYLVAKGMITWSFPALVLSERMISIEMDLMLLCITATASFSIMINRLQEALAKRKRAEETLRTSEKKYRLIAENMADIITTMDMDLNFTYVSPSIIKLLGFTVEEALKHTIDQIMTPESFQLVSEAFAEELRLEATGTANPDRVRIMELEAYKRDGSIIWVENTASFIRDEDQKPVGILVVSRDITDRKKSEEALSQIFSMSLDMICIADIHTATFIKVNPAFTETLGYSEEELLQKPFLEFTHPDDMDSTRLVVEKELQKGSKVINFENRYQCKDGTYRWLSWVSHPDIKKGVTFAIARDITESKQNEIELKKSKALLDITGRMARVGGWEVDTETRKVSWTEETYRIHEVPMDYKPSLQETINFFHPEDRSRLEQAIQLAIEHGEPYDMEIRFITAQGEKLWTRSICRPEIIDGKTVRLKGTIQDITDRKNAENEMLHQKIKAERYLNLAGVIFIGLDTDGNINIANKKACDVLESSGTDIIGQNWFDNFIPQKTRNDVYAVFKQLIKGNIEPVEYYENPVVSKSGGEKLIAWHNTYVTGDNDKILGILGAGEDITEKRELEKQVLQARKMESIGTLAGGIAHDFNNILSSIIGFTELALDDAEKDSTVEDSLQEIYSGAKRARDLVKQILAFAKQSDEVIKPIQIDVIAKEALKFLRASIPATIKINQNIDKNLMIMGNSTQIHQIFMNICTNAAQAMDDDGGVLDIRIKAVVIDKKDILDNLNPGAYAVIKISDTGVGIKPEIMDKIFDPYFTTKDTGKGTGLGLAMIHGIVESYKGMIIADSSPGQGAVFTVYLPLIKGHRESDFYQPEILPAGDEKIMLVDDEAAIIKMTSRILKKLGYAVVFETSSVKALEIFRSNPDDFDLVITDMTMPEMTGDKLAAELMSIRRDIPVILCTGYSNKISDKLAADIGIKSFAYKPVTMADLAKTVRKVLDKAKSEN